MNEWTIFSSLLILFLAISLSFWRSRNETETTVTAAQLLKLYKAAHEEALALREQWADEQAEREERWAREREERHTLWGQERADWQRQLFEMKILVRMYEYRMSVAGITMEVEKHTRLHIAIYDLIVERLSSSDLKTLVFVLSAEGVQWDMIGGETLIEKAQEFVAILERRGLIAEFLRVARIRFPHVEWPEDTIEAKPTAAPPPAPPSLPKPKPRI